MSIEVKNLNFSYGNRQVLHDMNISIPNGTLVNVLGPNGVGKSTLFRCILGLKNRYLAASCEWQGHGIPEHQTTCA